MSQIHIPIKKRRHHTHSQQSTKPVIVLFINTRKLRDGDYKEDISFVISKISRSPNKVYIISNSDKDRTLEFLMNSYSPEKIHELFDTGKLEIIKSRNQQQTTMPVDRIAKDLQQITKKEIVDKSALGVFGVSKTYINNLKTLGYSNVFQNAIQQEPSAPPKKLKKQAGVSRKPSTHSKKKLTYIGVSRVRDSERYYSRITSAGKTEYLGEFGTQQQAARAYDKRSKQLGRTIFNFPSQL